DAAQRGIRVTLLSSFAKETMAAIPTRYGDVIVTRDDQECCRGRIRFRDQLVELASTGQVYASLDGVYKVKEGDLVVMSFPSGGNTISSEVLCSISRSRRDDRFDRLGFRKFGRYH